MDTLLPLQCIILDIYKSLLESIPWYLIKLALKRANITEGPILPGKADTGKFTKKIDAALHLGKSAEMYQQLNERGGGHSHAATDREDVPQRVPP